VVKITSATSSVHAWRFKIGLFAWSYANVLQLPEGGDFQALHCQPSTNFDRSTKLEFCTSPRLTQNPCYGLAFFHLSTVSYFTLVFVHILIAIASPITVCQTMKNVAGSPKNSMFKIFCPFSSSVDGGINKAKMLVTKSPSAILSILIVRLKDRIVNSPDNAQTTNIEYCPRKLLPRNIPNITEKKNIIVVSKALRTNA
jgi:hypothetical protein